MLRRSRVTGRIVIERTEHGWRYGVQQKRLLRWRVQNWSPWADGLNECIRWLRLAQAYLAVAQTAGGVRMRRGQRKRQARKVAEKMVGA